MNPDQSLVIFEAKDVSVVVPGVVDLITQWENHLTEKRVGKIPYNAIGQGIADDLAQQIGQAELIQVRFEKAAEAARKPDYDLFKAKKAATDRVIMGLSKIIAECKSDLLEFEREKIRAEEAINRQRQEEAEAARRAEEDKVRKAEEERRRQEQAERDRIAKIEADRRRAEAEAQAKIDEANRAAQSIKNKVAREEAQRKAEELQRQEAERQKEVEAKRQAELEAQALADLERQKQREAEQLQLQQAPTFQSYEAPKTAGLTTKVPYEFDIEDPKAFALWCWRTGRSGWVRRVEFEARQITEEINAESGERNFDGVRVYRVVAGTVKRAKLPKAIDVKSTRVEL